MIGDNGAGKSTLVKIIAGNFPPSQGSMRIDGAEVHFSRPIDARQHGVEIVYQDLALCDNLTAAANVFQAREDVVVLRSKVGLSEQRLEEAAARYRRALELRYWRQFSFPEIGRAMGRTAEAARKLWPARW